MRWPIEILRNNLHPAPHIYLNLPWGYLAYTNRDGVRYLWWLRYARQKGGEFILAKITMLHPWYGPWDTPGFTPTKPQSRK